MGWGAISRQTFSLSPLSLSICGMSAAFTLLEMLCERASILKALRINTMDLIVFIPVVGILAHWVICKRISASWGREVLRSSSVMKPAFLRNLYAEDELVTSEGRSAKSSLVIFDEQANWQEAMVSVRAQSDQDSMSSPCMSGG